MPDPMARKRLKKKMLDRWENEGGAIAADTTTADNTGLGSEDKGHGKKLLLGAITRSSARPHLKRRGPSLLGNESGSKRSVQRLGLGLRGAPNLWPRMPPWKTGRDSYLYIFDFCLPFLFPPKTTE